MTVSRWHVGIPLNEEERAALQIVAEQDRRSLAVMVSVLLKEALLARGALASPKKAAA